MNNSARWTLLGWTPVCLEAEDDTDRWGQPMIRLHATVTHGPMAGRMLKYLEGLYRSEKAAPMARRKLHGILGRRVPPSEYEAMRAWELHRVDAWAFLYEDEKRLARVLPWLPKDRGLLDQCAGWEPGDYMGWRPAGWYDPEEWARDPETFRAGLLAPAGFDDSIWAEAEALGSY